MLLKLLIGAACLVIIGVGIERMNAAYRQAERDKLEKCAALIHDPRPATEYAPEEKRIALRELQACMDMIAGRL